jgi:hypothetical protein
MLHSVALQRGVDREVPGRDSQARRGMDSPLNQAPACVSALKAKEEAVYKRAALF